MDAERLNLSKNDRSGNHNGLELSERQEKHRFFPSKRNKEQTRHVFVGTINFHLMLLVATRNLVKLVRSRHRLRRVGNKPVEGPISFNAGRERRFLEEQKVDTLLLLLFASTKFCDFGIPMILRVLIFAISRSQGKVCDFAQLR